MCGLVGVIGDLWNNDKKAFNIMLMMDTVRGPHSTGVAIISNRNRQNVKIVKDVDTPWDLMGKEEFWNGNAKRDVISGDLVGLMGHNRWATVGEIIPENAHPFEAGRIVGAQNGTLPEFSRKKLVDYEFYDTDTEALMFNIDLKGVDQVIPTIEGAWALTWYNKEEDTFNILRNKERPLFFAWKKNGKVLYYASEAWMIYAATEKANVELENDLVYHVDKDEHYSFKIGEPGKFGKHCLTKTELKGYEYKPKHAYPTHSYRPANVVPLPSTINSAKDSANVFQNGNGTTTSPSNDKSPYPQGVNDAFAYWAGKKDQFFEFSVQDGFSTDENKTLYIKGKIVNGGPEVRIYPSTKDPDLHALLGDKDALTFAGKVKKIKSYRNIRAGRDEIYVTVNHDTIMISQYKSKNTALGHLFDSVDVDAANNQTIIKPEETVIQVVANGNAVTPEQYNKMVDKGCAWCSAVPSIAECQQVIWLGNSGDFLCADCASNEEITQYAKQYI